VARIEAGRLDLELGDVTAQSLAQSTLKAFEADARNKGLAFEVQICGEGDRALRADASRLKQLTQVFVGNALRFTSEGGVTASFQTKIEAGDKARLRVEVRDTGGGVPESARAHLFDALAADKMDSNIRESGAGLGLHLAKRLAGLMNGSVGYEPGASGVGSVFWFEVGLKASQKSDKYADGEQMTLDARRLRLLVGENNAARRSVLLGYLNSFNCEVTCAPSAGELTEALSAAAYDAVVIGLSLDDCDPEDAAGDIRSLPSTAAMTPVVRLDTELEEAVARGALETLLRAPVTADSLLDALRAALDSDPAAVATLRKIA
jgi:CheY-like chemotaxis protein